MRKWHYIVSILLLAGCYHKPTAKHQCKVLLANARTSTDSLLVLTHRVRVHGAVCSDLLEAW
jgi:hypothetical protein